MTVRPARARTWPPSDPLQQRRAARNFVTQGIGAREAARERALRHERGAFTTTAAEAGPRRTATAARSFSTARSANTPGLRPSSCGSSRRKRSSASGAPTFAWTFASRGHSRDLNGRWRPASPRGPLLSPQVMPIARRRVGAWRRHSYARNTSRPVQLRVRKRVAERRPRHGAARQVTRRGTRELGTRRARDVLRIAMARAGRFTPLAAQHGHAAVQAAAKASCWRSRAQLVVKGARGAGGTNPADSYGINRARSATDREVRLTRPQWGRHGNDTRNARDRESHEGSSRRLDTTEACMMELDGSNRASSRYGCVSNHDRAIPSDTDKAGLPYSSAQSGVRLAPRAGTRITLPRWTLLSCHVTVSVNATTV